MLVATPSTPFWESGLDYITVSTLGGESSIQLLERGSRLLAEQQLLGFIKKPWGMAGFHGWKCGPVQLGERNKEALARISGSAAHDNWRYVYEVADNCSRADCQVTVRDTRQPQTVIRSLYGRAKRFSLAHHRERAVSLLETNTGSSTVYFNKRVSERFGRIYDKGNESGLSHYQGAVRYEVEFKGHAAACKVAQLHAAKDYGLECAGEVFRFLRERIPSFRFSTDPNSQHPDVPTLSSVSQRRYPFPNIADRQRQLAWLTTSVKSTVAALCRDGYEDEVLAALGLGHLVLAHVGHQLERQAS